MKINEILIEFDNRKFSNALADLRKIAFISNLTEMREWSTVEERYYNALPESDVDANSLTQGNEYWPVTLWVNEHSKVIYLITVIQPAVFLKQESGFNFFEYKTGSHKLKFPSKEVLIHESVFYYAARSSVEQIVAMTNLMFDIAVWEVDSRAYDIGGNLRPIRFVS